MKFNQDDTEALLQLLSWRRDVRHFERAPLTAQQIAKLLDAIDLAPSVGNSRPWRFVRVQSDTLRDRIYQNFLKSNSDAAGAYSGEDAEKYDKLKLAGLKEAPLQLAVFTDTEPSAGKGLGRQTMPETLTYSTIIAIHNLWLAARSMNIGVGWVSILERDRFAEMLDIPKEWQFTAYLCLGYPSFNSKTPELHEEDWQRNTKTEWIER
ncbi:5,6-dimethylbenzimidazole synthase [Lentilitoribacter sp. Alg239-R112]|uniref:5,6-dimethylbenzimidazole synthase n=1 Tax=Lentilitoribacter sp. Alg239-R112 TaxID=2305987 RepID=UPI0013A69386|nr:5,6-dimethylbenzimidazole synthase [Lentilitoribacter sp. Alg239-R112]